MVAQAGREVAYSQHEKVGVCKIKIRSEQTCSTAILGSFVSAEKLLGAWANCMPDYFECDFAIEYVDGYSITGIYPRKKGRARQSLGAYVRWMIERGGDTPAAVLDEYDVGDE